MDNLLTKEEFLNEVTNNLRQIAAKNSLDKRRSEYNKEFSLWTKSSDKLPGLVKKQ